MASKRLPDKKFTLYKIDQIELDLNHSFFVFAMLVSVDSISAISRQEAHDSTIKFCPSEHRSIMRKKQKTKNKQKKKKKKKKKPAQGGSSNNDLKAISTINFILNENYCAGHAGPSKKETHTSERVV